MILALYSSTQTHDNISLSLDGHYQLGDDIVTVHLRRPGIHSKTAFLPRKCGAVIDEHKHIVHVTPFSPCAPKGLRHLYIPYADPGVCVPEIILCRKCATISQWQEHYDLYNAYCRIDEEALKLNLTLSLQRQEFDNLFYADVEKYLSELKTRCMEGATAITEEITLENLIMLLSAAVDNDN